jgi:hypothetical protein
LLGIFYELCRKERLRNSKEGEELQAASKHLTRAYLKHDATGDEVVCLKQFKNLKRSVKKPGVSSMGARQPWAKKIVKGNPKDNDSAKSVQ